MGNNSGQQREALARSRIMERARARAGAGEKIFTCFLRKRSGLREAQQNKQIGGAGGGDSDLRRAEVVEASLGQ